MRLDGSELNCSGCNAVLTLENIGGYRCFCTRCVESMPEFPKDGMGYTIEGKYPYLKWSYGEPMAESQITINGDKGGKFIFNRTYSESEVFNGVVIKGKSK